MATVMADVPDEVQDKITGTEYDDDGMPVNTPNFRIPMKDFICKVLPLLGQAGDAYKSLSDEHCDVCEKLSKYASKSEPFRELWEAIDKVAKNQELNEHNRKALKNAPSLLGKLMAGRKEAVEDLRADVTSGTHLEFLADSNARTRKRLESDNPDKPVGDVTPNAQDYEGAAGWVNRTRDDMSHLDQSADFINDLQADIIDMNKALGLEGKSKSS